MRPAPRRGFTLIELLVVVAIIALLISILLPSLSRAREQGRQTVCIANLKSMGVAMTMYFGDNKDWFPYEKSNWPQGYNGGWLLSAFYYGGHPGRPGTSTSGATPFDYDNMRDTFAGRPFNRYMYQNLQTRLEKTTEAGKPDFENRRTELKQFFCPSDGGSFFNNDPNDAWDAPPTHYYQGSSYDINYQFVYLWAAGTAWDNKYQAYSRPNGPSRTYLENANLFLKSQRTHNVSRFIMLYEDAFDSSIYEKLPRMGWHKQYQRHSFLFLDAHAANLFTDVNKGPSGPNWKTNAWDTWYKDPNDPDYQYRTLGS